MAKSKGNVDKSKVNSKKSNAGRPTDYKESYNKQVEKLCLLGATDKDIADFFDICEATVALWKNKYPKFMESIKKGKDIADIKVAQSLYKKANGYNTKEITFEKIDTKVKLEISSDGISTDDIYKKKVIKKEVPPDSTAAIFWLKNRQPKKWRDKQELESINTQKIIYVDKEDKEQMNNHIDQVINDSIG